MSRITEGKGRDGGGESGGGGGEVVESAPTMGEMHKCDPTGKKWTRRYFVLDGASLSYYSSQHAFEGGKKPRGVLDLKRAAVILGPGANARRMPTPYVFAVMTDLPKTRIYTFCCDDEKYRGEWMRSIDHRTWHMYTTVLVQESAEYTPTPLTPLNRIGSCSIHVN